MVAMGEDEPPLLLCLLGALAGATVGAVVAFAIVGSISPVRRYDDYEDDDFEECDRPARNRARDRDEDDRY
jgi:hypothetical protein